MVKKNNDDSYTFADNFTGEKITFNLKPNQTLDLSELNANPKD
jgi:hypothetical protein